LFILNARIVLSIVLTEEFVIMMEMIVIALQAILLISKMGLITALDRDVTTSRKIKYMH
jgi:hypothetical protein